MKMTGACADVDARLQLAAGNTRGFCKGTAIARRTRHTRYTVNDSEQLLPPLTSKYVSLHPPPVPAPSYRFASKKPPNWLLLLGAWCLVHKRTETQTTGDSQESDTL